MLQYLDALKPTGCWKTQTGMFTSQCLSRGFGRSGPVGLGISLFSECISFAHAFPLLRAKPMAKLEEHPNRCPNLYTTVVCSSLATPCPNHFRIQETLWFCEFNDPHGRISRTHPSRMLPEGLQLEFLRPRTSKIRQVLRPRPRQLQGWKLGGGN